MEETNKPAEEQVAAKELGESFWRRLEWSEAEARLVGEFLRERVEVNGLRGRERLWERVGENCGVKKSRAEEVVSRVEGVLEKVRGAYGIREFSLYGEDEETTSESHDFWVKQTSRTGLLMIGDLLRKHGVWGADEHRGRAVKAGLREEKEKSGYSQDNLSGEELPKVFVPPRQGGPTLVSRVFAPQFQKGRDFSNRRVRRSLAHEFSHEIRALANRAFWRGHESEVEGKLSRPKNGEIGGFLVGSNMQGSEAVGDLFGIVVVEEVKRRNEGNSARVSVRDVVPLLAGRLDKMAKKYRTDGKTPSMRYLMARYALLHHLVQLSELGYGSEEAMGLVAAGVGGYVTLEKMPALIDLGMVERDQYRKMKGVCEDLADWLTDPGKD